MNRVWTRVAIAAAGLALLWFATMQQAGVRCEACSDLGGQPVCRVVHGASHEMAAKIALSNLCNELHGDLTSRLACQRAPTTSLHCSDDAVAAP